MKSRESRYFFTAATADALRCFFPLNAHAMVLALFGEVKKTNPAVRSPRRLRIPA